MRVAHLKAPFPLSATFLADLEEDWRLHGKEIFRVLRERHPQAYFQGIVSLARNPRPLLGGS
jgi:hypothetical protein